MSPPSSATLDTNALLTVFLRPSNDNSFAAHTVLHADDTALYRLLPLALIVTERIADDPASRPLFLALLNALRARICSCRWLKFRFLHLIQHPAYAAFWTHRPVFRAQCYTMGRLAAAELFSASTTTKTTTDTARDSASDVAPSVYDTVGLLSFAAKVLFNPDVDHAVRVRTLVQHGVPVRDAFLGAELIDAIVANHPGVSARADAHAHADALLRLGAVQAATKEWRRAARFADSRVVVYRARGSLLLFARGSRTRDASEHRHGIGGTSEDGKEDEQQFRVMSADGVALESGSGSRAVLGGLRPVRRVELRIPVDMIDVQSLHFWTTDIFAKRVESGHVFTPRSVVHPLYASELDVVSVATSPGTSGSGSRRQHSHDHHHHHHHHRTHRAHRSREVAASCEVAEDAEVVPSARTELRRMRKSATHTHPADEMDDATAAWVQDASVVSSVRVKKVFDSLARPMLVELRKPEEDGDMTEEQTYKTVSPLLMVKTGDDLMQDMGVQLMFRCFNHVWAERLSGENCGVPPYSLAYEVLPCSVSRGLMEGISGLSSLKEFDWKGWSRKHGRDPDRVSRMVASAAGSYIGTYVLGGRDRHYDNVLVKDEQHMFHIDFSYILGDRPPIDGPPLSLSPEMHETFQKLGVWGRFVEVCVKAFCALRADGGHLLRTAGLVFVRAGHGWEKVKRFMRSESSLNLLKPENEAVEWVRKQLERSSSDVGNWFKELTHETVVPAWFELLKKGFPPAMAVMQFMDEQKMRVAEAQAQSKLNEAVEDGVKVKL